MRKGRISEEDMNVVQQERSERKAKTKVDKDKERESGRES